MVGVINHVFVFIIIISLLYIFICLVFYVGYLIGNKVIMDASYDHKYDHGSLKTYLNICNKYNIKPFYEYKNINIETKTYGCVNVDISMYNICIDKKLLILYPLDYIKYMYGFIKNRDGCRVKGLWDDK